MPVWLGRSTLILSMTLPQLAHPQTAMQADTLFSPSEYTAALLMHVRSHMAAATPANVLELGTGSGVVLALMLALGAPCALGVDIEAAAVEATQKLLEQEGVADRAQVVRGDMWAACGTQRFDLIATNLPQFAAAHIDGDGRLPTWSVGGPDGRTVVDKFLIGLPQHLKAGGVALMTHNSFIDVVKTQDMLTPLGLQARVIYTASVLLSVQKMASLNPAVLTRFNGRGIYHSGEHWFADFHIVEISWHDSGAAT
jgi:release factor glutamine methyltransferase